MITLVRNHGDAKYSSFAEGTKDYASSLYEIDLLYRKFIWSYRKTNQNKILADLANKVEKVFDEILRIIANCSDWLSFLDS